MLPVTLWLTLTFILATADANLNPTAAINPFSALAPAPDTSFFHWAGVILGPVRSPTLTSSPLPSCLTICRKHRLAVIYPARSEPRPRDRLAAAVAWRALTGFPWPEESTMSDAVPNPRPINLTPVRTIAAKDIGMRCATVSS